MSILVVYIFHDIFIGLPLHDCNFKNNSFIYLFIHIYIFSYLSSPGLKEVHSTIITSIIIFNKFGIKKFYLIFKFVFMAIRFNYSFIYLRLYILKIANNVVTQATFTR